MRREERRGIALWKLMVSYCSAANEPNEPPVNVEIPHEYRLNSN